MSFSTILSAAIDGLGVELVRVESDVSNGLPVFHMVGYLSSEVKEAGERVRTAIRNSGFDFPAKRTVVNLSPATLRKRGASFDLPIAVAILESLGQISPEAAGGYLITGELGLDGKVRKVPGVLPIIMEGKQNGITRFIVPAENRSEGSLVSGVEVIGAESLRDVVRILAGEKLPVNREESEIEDNWEEDIPDFADTKGQENVKRAAEIAVAGGHNLLMIGPPGSGKSMTAKCIAGILPEPDMEESLEITKIYSVLGMLNETSPLIRKRPFREVHHTATRAALIGGGLIPRPGEISLAHGGSLITVDMALEQGRDVYALPGPVNSAMSDGCNLLIRQGAGILLSPEDLAEEWGLQGMSKKAACQGLSEDEKTAGKGYDGGGKKDSKNEKVLETKEKLVYSCLDLYPRSVDQVAAETKLDIRTVMELLVTLELEGYIREISKNQYIIARC